MKIMLLIIMVLLLVSSSLAYESIDYSEKCEIVRPATEFRAAYSFGNIGVYGRLSTGKLFCFTPGNLYRAI